MKPSVKHCAIYTRKSSEEGLDQDFNSLDAQREACLSYIHSQKSEGWQALRAEYNDGGFSGGNMQRPGLQRLMADIAARKVSIVVVYKIDRLTRSLMDFAKLVEVFDRHEVTFVSVTQSFNTTTSMGRLTLNVLLSFAQFEREVTGERIRDKIAASKQKGMWMGGATPMGFDCVDHKLLINTEDAMAIKIMFEQYLIHGCVRKLKNWLDLNGYRTKTRVSQKGRSRGGASFSRGLLYKMLANPVYIGQIKHKDRVYPGQHEAIIPQSLWNDVQAQLSHQATIQRGSLKTEPCGNLLKGKIVDTFGNKYSPSFTSKGKKQYRYYISQCILQHEKTPVGILGRISAREIEAAVRNALANAMREPETAAKLMGLDMIDHQELITELIHRYAEIDSRKLISKAISKVEIGAERAQVSFVARVLLSEITCQLELISGIQTQCDISQLFIPINDIRQASGSTVLLRKRTGSSQDPFGCTQQELKDWVRGIIWRDDHFNGMTLRAIAQREDCSEAFVAKLIQHSLTKA